MAETTYVPHQKRTMLVVCFDIASYISQHSYARSRAKAATNSAPASQRALSRMTS